MIEVATTQLAELGANEQRFFTRSDLASVFTSCTPRNLSPMIRYLVDHQFLERLSRGVYLNRLARTSKSYLVEEVACFLRKESFNYISLESILSEFGVISQIMISRITVMTTGASGTFMTPYGTIEFTHTKRSVESLLARTIEVEGRPLRIATKQAALADLRRVGRNINMIDVDEINITD
jgi:predicted transcriptional regulator of viral defense system